MRSGRRLLAVACCSVLWLGVCATGARAQAIHEGKLTGTVAGEDRLVMPGVTVEVSGPALIGGPRSATTSRSGTYVVLNLPIGRYTVNASLAGFKTVVRENVEISPDTTITLDFVLPVGGINETVTVTRRGPRSSTPRPPRSTRKIDKDLLDRLPTSRDAFSTSRSRPPACPRLGELRDTLPSPTAYASATNENVFLINGVNATNPEAGAFGSLVNVNYDAVEEVRIVGLGSKAEYGSFSGAAIDVDHQVRQQRLPRQRRVLLQARVTVANNQPGAGEDLGAPCLHVNEGDLLAGDIKTDWETSSGTVGGPIVKDKLWFFGAFDYLRGTELPPRSALKNESWGRYADLSSPSPVRQAPRLRRLPLREQRRQRVELGHPARLGHVDDVRLEDLESTPSRRSGSGSATGTTVMSAKCLGFWTDDTPYLPEDAPDHPGYINWWKWTDAYGSSASTAPSPTSTRRSRAATPSRPTSRTTPRGSWAQHDIKFGVQYTKGRSNSQDGYFQNYVNFLYPYRWTQSVQYMQSWYGDTGLLFYNHKDTINPFLTVRTADSAGAFFDDQWSPTRRLTINARPPLRPDEHEVRSKGKIYDFVNSPDEVNGPPPVIRERASTGNIFDFKTWSPRLGVIVPAHRGRQDRGAGVIRPVLHAAQRRVPETVRPRRAAAQPDVPALRGGTVGLGRHERRRRGRHAGDAGRGAPGRRADADQRGIPDDRPVVDAQRGRQPEGPVHRPGHR